MVRGRRALLRHREGLVSAAAAHIQRMQKALMQMNIQLHHVVTDVTGVTGLKIIRDILASVHDPKLPTPATGFRRDPRR